MLEILAASRLGATLLRRLSVKMMRWRLRRLATPSMVQFGCNLLQASAILCTIQFWRGTPSSQSREPAAHAAPFCLSERHATANRLRVVAQSRRYRLMSV